MPALSTGWGTVAQAAQILAVSEKTIRRRITDGTIEAQRFGPRLIRVDLESLTSSTNTGVSPVRESPKAQRLEEYVARVVGKAPELTDDQRHRLGALLNSGGGALV
jgi:excisionase family DNA binding protein